MKAEEAEAPALLIKLSRLQCVLLLNTVCLTHAHTASRYTLIQRLQLMLYIYNLLQTFLYSDMQIGELRGQKHSENLTRVPQSPRVQSQLGGSKISWGGGGVGRGGEGLNRRMRLPRPSSSVHIESLSPSSSSSACHSSSSLCS